MSHEHLERNDPDSAANQAIPRFSLGSEIRVRKDTDDPDCPGIRIGGWMGTIVEMDTLTNPHEYLIRWNEKTLEQMPADFVQRCLNDELEVEVMWLREDVIESEDASTANPSFFPSAGALTTSPELSERLRTALGLHPEEPIPPVQLSTLTTFHAHLLESLAFPFLADYLDGERDSSLQSQKVRVLRLLPVTLSSLETGLLCEIERLDNHKTELAMLLDLEAAPQEPGHFPLSDFAYWFTNYPAIRDVREPELNVPPEFVPRNLPSLGQFFGQCAVVGGVYGGTLGCLRAVIPGTDAGIVFGAGVLGIPLGLLGQRYGKMLGQILHLRSGSLAGLLLGISLGGLLGSLMGALAVAFLGSLPGSMLGWMCSGRTGIGGRAFLRKLGGALTGAILGGVAFAAWTDHQQSARGLLQGGILGALMAMLLAIVASLCIGLALRKR